MRVEGHAVWGRGFPVKYLLVQEDEDGEDRYWGRCADVEGLFADRVRPPREVLTLRGCALAGPGPLRTALSPGGNGSRSLGDVLVEVSDGHGLRPPQLWTLVDAVVLAHRPNPVDPSLVDVVVGAGVDEEEVGDRGVPPSPRFEVYVGSAVDPAGNCQGVDGLYTARPGPAKTPLHLIGCDPAEPLLAALRNPRRRKRGWAQLWALDSDGRVMRRHHIDLEVAEVRPSVLGGTLIDITLADGGRDRPPLIARRVWERWYEGIPGTPNTWARHPAKGRHEWLMLAMGTIPSKGDDRSGGTHHLDGRFATDVEGLHCAMGEALLGPGGYYGWGWDAFRDCLCGGFGVAPPFTLVWHDSGIAREALADVMDDPRQRLSYFEGIVQVLRDAGVTVVFV